MIVRRLVSRRAARKGSTEEEPRRERAARFVVIVLSAGLLAGVSAWLSIWPFGNVQQIVAAVFGSGTIQVPAQTVFPSVGPVHKVVDVYDTPPPARRTTSPTQPPQSGGSPEPRESPEPGDD